LRYSNVYGPRQNPYGEAGVVAIFSLKIINGVTPVINGDGKQTRDYVYVDDVVKANIAALDTKSVGSYNIATGIETNVLEIFQKLKKHLRSNIRARHGPSRLGEQQRSSLDIHLAKVKLGWKPETTFNQGLIKTAEYFVNYEKRRS
jgi:UDP-glucose 4-epimerase